MGLSQSVCGILSCSQKEKKEIKEIKVDYKSKRTHEEYLKYRTDDKIKCCLCNYECRFDNIHRHYKDPNHRNNTIKHCIKENIHIPIENIDVFIKVQNLYNRKYNRSCNGDYFNEPMNNCIYIEEYIEIYKEKLKKRNESM